MSGLRVVPRNPSSVALGRAAAALLRAAEELAEAKGTAGVPSALAAEEQGSTLKAARAGQLPMWGAK